jgi:hypothetical protein
LQQYYLMCTLIIIGQHEAMLQQLGWTKYDFDTGIREEAVTDAFAAYENLLKTELSTGK